MNKKQEFTYNAGVPFILPEKSPNLPDLKLDLAYSYFYEKFMAKFYSRLDKLMSFLTMVMAIISLTGLVPAVVPGFVIVILVFFQITSQSGVKAQTAKRQAQDYLNIYNDFEFTSLDETRKSFVNLQIHDLEEVGSFSYPAQLAAFAMLGFTPDRGYSAVSRGLNLIEKCTLWFIGENLEYPL